MGSSGSDLRQAPEASHPNVHYRNGTSRALESRASDSQSTAFDERCHDLPATSSDSRRRSAGPAQDGREDDLRKSIAVRTSKDWNNPPPGYFEMDMVAHCGRSVAVITCKA